MYKHLKINYLLMLIVWLLNKLQANLPYILVLSLVMISTLFLSLLALLNHVNECKPEYSTTCSSSQHNTIRLYNTLTDVAEDGAVQICYSGTWYAECDYYWDCAEANVACKQLGYDKARANVNDADGYFGHWSNIRHYYHSCSGSQSSLTYCGYHHTSSSHCYSSSDEAGVRCVATHSIDSICSTSGSLSLTGGNADGEGVLEYCYNGKWSPFCSLDTEEAAVACKQLGYSKYVGFLSPGEYTWDFPTSYTGSVFNYFTCSSLATESSLSECTLSATTSYSSCGVACEYPKAIKCYDSSDCTDGEVRLANGSISQEGRVEICVNGIWGGVCGTTGWTKQTAFVVCKQMGYVYSEPVIYTNSKYGIGMVPIVYSSIQCNGWEKSITECTKTNYLHFTCSSTAGVLCPDDCTNGAVRLIGGTASNEGTIEICINNLWGMISDAGWDENDAKVICRQLDLPYDGAQPVYDSYYGKPDRTIHYSFVLCNGDEATISSCDKVTHSLIEGRKIYKEDVVAGVVCEHATPTSKPPCVPISNEQECTNGELQVDDNGIFEYCVDGTWSFVCHLTHNETTVVCRQLGYTTFTWGLPYDIDSMMESSTPDVSLISNISCTSIESSLDKCTINKQVECMKQCTSVLGLKCYEPGDCTEGDIRLVDGIIEQEGRVEVCVNGVWGSICDDGWDKTDAHVVCRQMGFSSLEPLAFSGDHFGSSSGPLVYSNIDCGGWENSIEECVKKSHFDIQCSHRAVAGVMCSDDCSDGDVRLVGSNYQHMGTVEVCRNNLWGLINEEEWGLADANVICHQLGYKKADNGTTGSLFGHPNKVIHIGSVNCDGKETNINQCSAKHYSISVGKNMTSNDDIGIAGVVCHIDEVSTTTITPTTTISVASTSPSNTRTVSGNSTTNSPSVLMIVVLSLLCFVILLMSLIAAFYCFYKLQKKRVTRKRKSRHPVSMTINRMRQQHNQYDTVTESSEEEDGTYTEKLIKETPDDDNDIDITFKGSGDDDPVYEECSTINIVNR